ncbi:MAG: sugar ABC transporter permease [Oscillospiraceae bacterium]|nr:sugar ABC transporter permease [Oscillospiraceae bacterium]
MKLPYQKRKALYGYAFISLWLVGTAVFFLYPLICSLIYSFQKVQPGEPGVWVGLKNYIYVFTGDPKYTACLLSVLRETLWKTPLILIFSLFIAVMLNQKFRGRTLARAVFFLPVIIATGPVYNIINGDIAKSGAASAGQFSTMFRTDLMGDLLQFLGIYGLTDHMEEMIGTVSDNLFGIVWNAGIQILIFLAALQTIPTSAREAAQIEGATGWEYFWKITLPYVSPMVLACLIYTVIDSFTSPDNLVMQRFAEMRSNMLYGYAAAMIWVYFGIVSAAVGVITLIVNRFVYYETE